jgi:putative transposase
MEATLREKAEQLAKEMAEHVRTPQDVQSLMRTMMKAVMEQALDVEMDHHLGRRPAVTGLDCPEVALAALPNEISAEGAAMDRRPRHRNRRNGHSSKTVRADLGEITLATPRDREGTFEPLLVPKHQRQVTGFDEKILALYAKGMSTRDIQEILQDLYGVEVSTTLISDATAAIDTEVGSWRSRPIFPVWPIVYFDGIVVHVRGASGRVSQHTIYVALGVNIDGKKELLGLWLAESEGAKFWLSVLTDLKNRGLEDILVACIDGLAGFAEAIHTVYERAKVQLCVVHLVRAALRYVSDQDSKAVVRDLKKIYQAPTVLDAERALAEFAQAWDAKYPTISKQWRAKWTDIITLFEFPAAIRRAIATTNAIESVNSVIRKLTRNRKIYPNEDSALKIVYLAIREASKKWSMPIRRWKEALNHFAILFDCRLPS